MALEGTPGLTSENVLPGFHDIGNAEVNFHSQTERVPYGV